MLGARRHVLPPRDRAWRAIAPGFDAAVRLAASGIPFQIAADGRYDRTGDARRLPAALAAGKTVFLPQVHQVLPRLMRLMAALRIAFIGPAREECSFLFLVEGTGRPGMGLHHDGEVDAFWLQLEGRRTVTTGPPVRPGTPLDLPERPGHPGGSRPGARPRDRRPVRAGSLAGWWTRDLTPGTLFYLPPRTPHRVVCHGRSLAISLTWARARRGAAGGRGRADQARLLAWDVVSGYAESLPAESRRWLWTQVPAIVGPIDPARRARPVRTADGTVIWMPASPGGPPPPPLARLPRLARAGAEARLAPLLRAGILAPRDLPLRIVPDDPATLDGWRFA